MNPPCIRLRHAACLCVLGAMLGACGRYIAPVMPPQGVVFSAFSAPLTVNFDQTPSGHDLKRAKDKTHYVFPWLFNLPDVAWGETDVALIARKAGIQHVAYADYEYLQVLGFYASFTVNVYGYEKAPSAESGEGQRTRSGSR
ncbi:MAG: hypothetical protein Kow0059_08200 [Candidatus Sumerlaeia bacterium]